MKIHILIIILLSAINLPAPAQEQRVTEFGLTGGPIRFYPKAQQPATGLRNSLENGWGWSGGIYVEDHRFLKLHPVVELNHYTLSTDVLFQEIRSGQNNTDIENQQSEQLYPNTSFHHIAFSGGLKYFFIPGLFIYPSAEAALALNPFVKKNHLTFRLKAAAGVNLGVLDVMLEYAWGLYRQRMVFNEAVPHISNYRNRYLQLKIQIPLYKIGRIPPDWKGNRYLK